jgi:hypothetical protein
MIETHGFFMIMFAFGCVMGVLTLVYVIRRAFGRQAGEIGGWELRGASGRIRAVARTTLAEGLRAKVASGFALLILVGIPLFWLTAEGDGTIKGRVQMFTTYALGFTGFVLALLTIFFSCRSLAVEVASQQIYAIVSKPIPRWQILAGKWLGIMSLNVLLLVIASVATYAGTRAIMRSFQTHLRHELETSGGLTPGQAARAVAALDHVKGVGKEGRESPIVHAMARALGQSSQEVVEVLMRLPEATRVDLRRFDELRRQVLVARASVRPEIPDLTEEVDRRYEQLKEDDLLPREWTAGQIRDQIKGDLLGDYCTVPPGMERRPWRLEGPVPQEDPDFIMSVRFKVHGAGSLLATPFPGVGTLEDDTLLCSWGIGDPTKPTFFAITGAYPVGSFVEFEIPVNCVEKDGTIEVRFANIDPRMVPAVFDLPSGLEVLYRVGSFELNVFQVFLAMLIPLACLASFGVWASTFLSFPVGSLIVITLYIITSSMGFVAEALAVTEEYAPPHLQDFWFELRRVTVAVIGWVLAIGDCDPVALLREGRVVGWPTLWENFWKFALLKNGLVMLIAVLVFRRRELAAVIV